MLRHPSLSRTDHRPWPLPSGPWRWAQIWSDLLFLHWRVPAATLEDHIPPGLELECYDGSAWIGVVPFRLMIRHRGLPPVPGVSFFPEINVRTYVTTAGMPGVWFFSLDATQPLAIRAARWLYHLPYRRAAIESSWRDETCRFRSRRTEEPRPADFEVSYRPEGPVEEPRPGSLEHFLTERYCLYVEGTDRSLWRGEVHHHPWPLRRAEAEIHHHTLFRSLGIPVTGSDPLCHFASSISVVTWPLRPVADASGVLLEAAANC